MNVHSSDTQDSKMGSKIACNRVSKYYYKLGFGLSFTKTTSFLYRGLDGNIERVLQTISYQILQLLRYIPDLGCQYLMLSSFHIWHKCKFLKSNLICSKDLDCGCTPILNNLSFCCRSRRFDV